MDLIYDMPLYRPPSEGGNLIIQATLGCSFNRCSFCAMYRTKRYVERPLAEVCADIRQAAADWPMRTACSSPTATHWRCRRTTCSRSCANWRRPFRA
ncbi:MAG TPA: hypothetical protein VFK88_12505 [Gallionella sp.]|nr:hypothetical protein [Gallionella sp.]